jgi:hypothetical protein
MDTTKKLVAFQKRQRRKLLKRLKVSEPIAKAKEQLKQEVEKAIEQQEVVKKRVGEKQQENINRFKELRSAFPELTDSQFTNYAREQLGLDVPKSAIAKLPEKERVKRLKEKIEKQPKAKEILVDIGIEKQRKQDIARQAEQAREMDVIKQGQLDMLNSEIDNIIKKRDDILKQTKTSLDELKKKYEGKGNQGRMTDDKKIFREYQKLEEQLMEARKKLPFTKKIVKITKKAKLEAEPAIEEAKPAAAAEEAKPAVAIEDIPEAALDVGAYSKEVEELRVDIAKQLANLSNAKDEDEKNQYLEMIGTLSSQIDKLGATELSKVIDLEATTANQKWEKANLKPKPVEKDDLFGKGLRRITKKNIALYHIGHKNIKDMGNEYTLSKKGMIHAGNLARILRPKDFERALTFSLVNHIKKSKK